MCGSRKNPYPPHGRSLEIPKGRGVLKAKFLEEMYENRMGFPGGRGEGGAKQKPSLGQYRYFLELHNVQPTKRIKKYINDLINAQGIIKFLYF